MSRYVHETERIKSGGKDSHLRRVTPRDLQSRAIDYSATSGNLLIISDLLPNPMIIRN